MITKLTLSNFRAIYNPVSVTIRPITVLIGRNSSGKSTILKFLLMLRQSLKSGDPFLVTEGDDVHLGALQELRNSKSSAKYLRFSLDYDQAIWDDASFALVPPPDTDGSKNKDADHTWSMTFKNPKSKGQEPDRVTATLSAKVSYDSSPKGEQSLSAWDGSTRVLHRTSDIAKHSLLDFPVDGDQGTFENTQLPSQLSLHIRELLLFRDLADQFKNMHHLGPIREELQRTMVAGTPPRTDVGKRGEYTLLHLQRLLRMKKRLRFATKHVKSIAGIDRLSFGNELSGYLALAKARNRKTTAINLLADFGCGVSQFLPILVQGSLLDKNHTLLVEQPEAHLHPDAQMETASFFADLLKTRQVNSIVETHSGNFVLRLRHLVRQGVLTPDDVNIAYFTQDRRGTHVRNLAIQEDGRLEKGLPMEFFGGDIIEAMKMAGSK